MIVNLCQASPQGASRPTNQTTREAGQSTSELVDSLAAALVEARLAVDALTKSLRAKC
jgi:hypothetical protein